MKSGPRVPVWATTLGWCLAILFLGSYFFVAHAVMRGLVPTFGWDAGDLATATFGTVAMGLGVVWFVALAELPEIWYLHRRPPRLMRQGRCPACGHPIREAGVDRCGECGIDASWLPTPYVFGWKAARRFTVALILGFLCGVLAAEISIAVDELRMRSIIENTKSQKDGIASNNSDLKITFTRAWPASFSRVGWTTTDGFQPERIFGP